MNDAVRTNLVSQFVEVLSNNHPPATSHERVELARKLVARLFRDYDYDAMAHMATEMAMGLEACRKQFLFYAEQHRAKETEEGNRKAEVNEGMANMCSAIMHGAKVLPWAVADMLWDASDPETSRGDVSEFYDYGEFDPGQIHEVSAAVSLPSFYVWRKDDESAPMCFLTKEAAEISARVSDELTKEG